MNMNEAAESLVETGESVKFTPRTLKNFWNKVINGRFTDCWLWNGAGSTIKHGYGYFSFRGRPRLAHRISWMMRYGKEIPKELDLCHKCDNPRCVNPDHLFLGTALDNARDMDSKGRRVNRPSLGSKNGWSKINEEIVREIRVKYAAGVAPIILSEQYGVSRQLIWRVGTRRDWKHVA